MILQPRQTKFRKMHKNRNRGVFVGALIHFGRYGLKATTRGRLTSRQIESARRVIAHTIKRQGRIWIRVFPDKPITKKPLEIRMGKGKGSVEYWVSLVQPGRMLYEVDGVSRELAFSALMLASDKLPVKTTFAVKAAYEDA